MAGISEQVGMGSGAVFYRQGFFHNECCHYFINFVNIIMTFLSKSKVFLEFTGKNSCGGSDPRRGGSGTDRSEHGARRLASEDCGARSFGIAETPGMGDLCFKDLPV
jgi:hypothetical protein